MNKDWREIRQGFKQHFDSEQTRLEDGEVSFDNGSSKFTISKSGTINASMPLHSFISESFSEIRFKDKHVKVVTKDAMYEFRI